MEKYITIPVEELSKKERRIFPDGMEVLNPEWKAADEEAVFQSDETAKKLIAAGGERNGMQISIKFNGHTFLYAIGSGFKFGGAGEEKLAGPMLRELGI